MDQYNKQRADIMAEAEGSFEKNFSTVNEDIVSLLTDGLGDLSTQGGKFATDAASVKRNRLKLLKLKKKLRELLSQGKYGSKVDGLIKDLIQLDKLNAEAQYEVNGITVSKKLLTKAQNIAVDNVTTKMTENIDSAFVQPLTQALNSNIVLGTSISQTQEFLKNYVMGDAENQGKLERYAGQMARDSVSQYDGILNQAIATEYDMSEIMYVGSVVKDSRPQCIRWVQQSILSMDTLDEEISWAFNNGSGMIESTNKENFCVYRGGYNCRHAAIPVTKDTAANQ